MNIAYQIGDATRPQADGAKIIVHVCNDVGGWGRGFVVALSRRWPEPEKQFRAWYRGGLSQPFALGEVQFVSVAPDTTVANLIGQHGLATRQRTPPVRYDAIRLGLRSVATSRRPVGVRPYASHRVWSRGRTLGRGRAHH